MIDGIDLLANGGIMHAETLKIVVRGIEVDL